MSHFKQLKATLSKSRLNSLCQNVNSYIWFSIYWVIQSKIFGHMVFIYLVFQFRSNGPVSNHSVQKKKNLPPTPPSLRFLTQICKYKLTDDAMSLNNISSSFFFFTVFIINFIWNSQMALICYVTLILLKLQILTKNNIG